MSKSDTYTYPFASATDHSPVGYFRKLQKKYIKAVLRDLRRNAHHAYILLENLPQNHFAIVRSYDYRYEVGVNKHWKDDESFSISHFLHYCGLFHPKDGFRILFYGEVLYYEQGFTPHTLERFYLHYLKTLCERRLRENAPLCLTRDMIREFGLTRADVKIVRELLDRYNTDATDKIQAEYNALKTLDFILK